MEGRLDMAKISWKNKSDELNPNNAQNDYDKLKQHIVQLEQRISALEASSNTKNPKS
jgi:hypothetical protein